MAKRPRDEDEANDNRLLLWLRGTIAGMVRSSDLPDLSMRQLGVLLICHTAERPQTVRSLASVLDTNKPAITRALDRLASSTLVRRLADPADGRSVLVEVARSGHALCRTLGKATKST
jgi:DNA-binding MarR family transcriptional regulator